MPTPWLTYAELQRDLEERCSSGIVYQTCEPKLRQRTKVVIGFWNEVAIPRVEIVLDWISTTYKFSVNPHLAFRNICTILY